MSETKEQTVNFLNNHKKIKNFDIEIEIFNKDGTPSDIQKYIIKNKIQKFHAQKINDKFPDAVPICLQFLKEKQLEFFLVQPKYQSCQQVLFGYPISTENLIMKLKLVKINFIPNQVKDLSFFIRIAQITKTKADDFFNHKNILQANKFYLKAIRQLQNIPKEIKIKNEINFIVKYQIKFFELLNVVQDCLNQSNLNIITNLKSSNEQELYTQVLINCLNNYSQCLLLSFQYHQSLVFCFQAFQLIRNAKSLYRIGCCLQNLNINDLAIKVFQILGFKKRVQKLRQKQKKQQKKYLDILNYLQLICIQQRNEILSNLNKRLITKRSLTINRFTFIRNQTKKKIKVFYINT